jgi:S-adenosylmethionine-diacylglycerol 3-amino-3-carboxypropyl transferase
MKNNPVQFAVVREDPLTELAVIEHHKSQKALLIGSGGCSALSLLCIKPTLEITIFDTNPAQIALLKEKVKALTLDERGASFKAQFGIGSDSLTGLNTKGNFESLFRGLRHFIFDLVATKEEMLELFGKQDHSEIFERITSNKFWPVAFDLFLSDSILRAMFTDAAVQHVEKGSYPQYFRKALEKGLKSKDAPDNYFLHHIFLGHYLECAKKLPVYLSSDNRNFPIKCVLGDLHSVENISDHDFISLSNIFDWMTPGQVEETAKFLTLKCKKGTSLLWRQLGHDRDMSMFFPEWTFDRKMAEGLLATDRSLFYSRYYVATRK